MNKLKMFLFLFFCNDHLGYGLVCEWFARLKDAQVIQPWVEIWVGAHVKPQNSNTSLSSHTADAWRKLWQTTGGSVFTFEFLKIHFCN